MPGNAGGGGGNRQDNRQRGNAAQLLEKYKSLARDAQLAGDRVQTEYYLQYADHYFRVLEENRSRYEEQQAQRRPRRDDDDYDVDSDGDEEMSADSESGDEDGEVEARQRPNRDRGNRERGGRERFERRDRFEPRANGAARDDDREEEESEERISLGVLPPAIGAGDEPEAQDVAPKPRRRARKPKAEEGGEDDIAPAA
jgi:hypothetical protein